MIDAKFDAQIYRSLNEFEKLFDEICSLDFGYDELNYDHADLVQKMEEFRKIVTERVAYIEKERLERWKANNSQ
jgi:hypothetical protein